MPSEASQIKKLKSSYNLVPTVLWSILGFTPIGYFYYVYVELSWLYLFLVLSSSLLFLPQRFFWLWQLSNNRWAYEAVGIRLVKKLTQDGDLINQHIQKQFPNHKNLNSKFFISKAISKSYVDEKIHLIMLLFFLFTTIYAVCYSHYLWALVITLANIIFNFYPILLQQYNRLRLQRIAARQLIT